MHLCGVLTTTMLVIVAVLCGARPVLSSDRCNGLAPTITALSGRITDHNGPGVYLEDQRCEWLIRPVVPVGQPPVTGLEISFSKLDLEFEYDTISFRSESGTVLGSFSGTELPAPFVINQPSVRVTFYSDSVVVASGFEFSFKANNCPDRCSGRGTCNGGVCACRDGWAGSNCSVQVCTPTCNSPFGQCSNATGVCQCDAGYYGPACTDVYCSGQSIVLESSGQFEDHRGQGISQDRSRCQWLIHPANRSFETIRLWFSKFELESAYDFVRIYDGDSVNDTESIGVFSGTRIPGAVYAFSGQMLVSFTTDDYISLSGFRAHFETLNCGGCQNGGVCFPSGCRCPSGWSGPSCTERVCAHNCWQRGQCNSTTQICDCQAPFHGVDCGLCNGPNCSQTFCPQRTEISSFQTGQFFSNTGGGTYRERTLCYWRLDMPSNVSAVHLQFSPVDLATGSTVFVYDGDALNLGFANVPQIGAIRGPTEEVQDFFSTGPQLTVGFVSGTQVDGGFRALYTPLHCQGHCNDQGTCLGENLCHCDLGWEGANCSQAVCPPSCNVNGRCDARQRCVCNVGWYGADCSMAFCVPSSDYREVSGVIKDRARGNTYPSNTRCEFLIRPEHNLTGPVTPEGQYLRALSVLVTRLSLEEGYDFLEIFDGPTTSYPRLYRGTGYLPSPPLKSNNGQMLVVFSSDNIGEYQGFQLNYSLGLACPNGCGEFGYCLSGRCLCHQGYAGLNCSQRAPLLPLPLDTLVEGVVEDFQWRYYALNVTQAFGELVFSVGRPRGGGNPAIYIRYHDLPTTEDYNFLLQPGFGVGSTVSFSFPLSGRYVVGVYGAFDTFGQGNFFSVRAIGRCPVAGCGESATCDEQKGECICRPCFTGYRCDQIDPELPSCAGDSFGSGLVAALVLSILIMLFFFACFVVVAAVRLRPRGFVTFEDLDRPVQGSSDTLPVGNNPNQ